MTLILDDISRYQMPGGDIETASAPLGMLLAWCADQRFLSEAVEREHETLLLRMRMREVGGSQLIVALGGRLEQAALTAEGARFISDYLPSFREDLEAMFGEGLPEDSPDNYTRLAKALTARRFYRRKSRSGGIGRWLSGLAERFKA